MAYQIAQAWIVSGKSKADELIAKLKFSTCDPKWRECIEEYVAYFKLQHHNIPYREGLDNILPLDIPVSRRLDLSATGEREHRKPERFLRSSQQKNRTLSFILATFITPV